MKLFRDMKNKLCIDYLLFIMIKDNSFLNRLIKIAGVKFTYGGLNGIEQVDIRFWSDSLFQVMQPRSVWRTGDRLLLLYRGTCHDFAVHSGPQDGQN